MSVIAWAAASLITGTVLIAAPGAWTLWRARQDGLCDCPAGYLPAAPGDWPSAVIWPCGCAIAYHHDGGTRLAPCWQHAQHQSWREWERQMGKQS